MKIHEFKRVLVLSHNAFSETQNNGKTMEAFFADWPSSKLAQIFLQAEAPDWSFCQNYFQLSDFDLLNNLLTQVPPGRVLSEKRSETVEADFNPLVKHLYRARRASRRSMAGELIHKGLVNRQPSLVWARDLLWARDRWKTLELENWIENFAPEVLFFQGSSAPFGYRMARWICERFSIPLVLQLTDDYSYLAHPYSPFDVRHNRQYIRSLTDGIVRASTVVAISDAMAKEYETRFGGNYRVLMNSVSDPTASEASQEHRGESGRFVYAGNLGLDRWKQLALIGEALVRCNARSSSVSELHVFAPVSTPPEVVSSLMAIPSIRYRGFVQGAELASEIQSAQYLVHVESFNEEMQNVTRMSISTKIPEYLAAGKVIYAFGPSTVESINYLQREDAAHVTDVMSSDEVEKDLILLTSDETLRERYLLGARSLYEDRHTPEMTRAYVKEIVKSAAVG